jgi:hypothetical protein
MIVMTACKKFIRLGSMALLLLMSGWSAFGHRDRVEWPRAISIAFTNGESATFLVAGDKVTAVTLRIGDSKTYTVPTNVCVKLREIRFETVKLLWNGSYKTAEDANYFYLAFSMGPLRFGRYPDEPRVELFFQEGKFVRASGIDIPK